MEKLIGDSVMSFAVGGMVWLGFGNFWLGLAICLLYYRVSYMEKTKN